VAHYEICTYLEDNWLSNRDDDHKVPFMSKDTQWIGYDDLESLREKVTQQNAGLLARNETNNSVFFFIYKVKLLKEDETCRSYDLGL
jgi:hypothetical protein